MRYSLLIFFCLTLHLALAVSDTVVFRDLKLDWKTVDAEGRLNSTSFESSEFIIFELPDQADQLLRISTREPVDFWVNDQLILHDFKGTRVYQIDQMAELYGNLERLSIYQKGGIVDLKTELVQVRPQSILWNPRLRLETNQGQVFLILLLVVAFTGGIFKRISPGFFKNYLEVAKIRNSGLSSGNDAFNQTALLRIIYLSMLLATISSYLGIYFLDPPRETLTLRLLWWVINVFAFLILLGLKQLYAVGVSKIYGYRGAALAQLNGFSTFFSFAALICLALLILDFTMAAQASSFYRSFAFGSLVITTIAFQFWAFLKLDNLYAERKLMIFTYLCTTEMAPGFLILYWLDKLG